MLEGLFLFMDHSSPDSFGKINGFRGQSNNANTLIWEPLFYQMDNNKIIKICISDHKHSASLTYQKDENYLPSNATGISEDILAQFRTVTKATYSLRFTYNEKEYHEEGHYSLNGASVLRDITTSLPGNEIRIMAPTQFINSGLIRATDEVLNGIGKLELSGEKDSIIQVLKELDPSIEDILTVSLQGFTQLYIRVNGKLIPLQFAGDGVAKLLNVCLAIMDKKNGLVLVDEIETGFHYSMYGKLWKIIDRISKKANCQIIATTHSYELIAAACNDIDIPEDFTYYRMDRRHDNVSMYRYSLPMLNDALKSELEVR